MSLALPEVEARTGISSVAYLLASIQTAQVNPDGHFELDCHSFAELLKGDESGWPEVIALHRADFTV